MQEDTYQEAKQHFNEPILIGFDLCRCVGYAEDDSDCYLVYLHPLFGKRWCTFVGGYTYLGALRGQGHVTSPTGEEWDDFIRLDIILELNGAPKQPHFICDLTKLVPAVGVEPTP